MREGGREGGGGGGGREREGEGEGEGERERGKIGRAHVRTPVTSGRLLRGIQIEKKNQTRNPH